MKAFTQVEFRTNGIRLSIQFRSFDIVVLKNEDNVVDSWR